MVTHVMMWVTTVIVDNTIVEITMAKLFIK